MEEFIEDVENATLTCPTCGSDEHLWAGVSAVVEGWRNIKIEKTPNGPEISYLEIEYDHGVSPYDADIDGTAGCSECAWGGFETDLVYEAPPRLGWDGQPLKKIPDNQMKIDDAI